MVMDQEKAKQEISLIGRLFSLEALIVVMGITSLVYGIIRKQSINIFWGIMILCGFVVLILVRRRDWKKHWDALEQQEKRDREGK